MKFKPEELQKQHEVDEELATLNSSNMMLDSESDSDFRSIMDTPWSDNSTLQSLDEKVNMI